MNFRPSGSHCVLLTSADRKKSGGCMNRTCSVRDWTCFIPTGAGLTTV
ncbi:hypothetical protein EVA_11967 [gut metagenome]|uniref:Uncharacterized protein n=1 Tax=gut metagenome TaxID=749906 RepID=J9GDR1_9ZZZZ